MSNQMPYKVSYSLGQQNCRRCSQIIELNQLQIAIMMQVNFIFSSFCNYFEFYLGNRNRSSTKKLYISSMSDVLKCQINKEQNSGRKPYLIFTLYLFSRMKMTVIIRNGIIRYVFSKHAFQIPKLFLMDLPCYDTPINYH